jgi:hypothetical protein
VAQPRRRHNEQQLTPYDLTAPHSAPDDMSCPAADLCHAGGHPHEEAHMPAIRQFLDLSTAHLPKDIRDALSAQPGVVAYALTYGWLMWVPDDPDGHCADGEQPVPDVVLTIQRYARERDCDYVLFDADADQVEGLPTWDR